MGADIEIKSRNKNGLILFFLLKIYVAIITPINLHGKDIPPFQIIKISVKFFK